MTFSPDCFVIGSGPSLEGFDFARLPPAYRIGANKSAWLADCDCLVTIDRTFHKHFNDNIAAFGGERIVCRNDGMEIEGVRYLNYQRGSGLSERQDTLCGTNSGFAALNVAYLKGYKRIGLLGMDFKWVANKSHFHDGYTWQNAQTWKYLRAWAKSFNEIVPQLNRAGVQVVNYVGPSGSGIDCFETRPLSELVT